MPKIIYDTQWFIKKARKVHGSKYNYSKVDYKKSSEKVTIICKEHGEFEQKPNNHLNGQGCLRCVVRWQNTPKTAKWFIRKARKTHGTKYDYSKVVYKNANTKVTIICPIHGEFQQTPYSHHCGKGCPKCSGNAKLTTKQFINMARKVHKSGYDYSTVTYKNAHTKVTIICKEHGVFEQSPGSHLRGAGCPVCSNNKKLTNEEFIKKARKVHGNRYDYSKVDYKNAITKVKIICPIHGEFLQTPGSHLRGHGCKSCLSKPKLSTKNFIVRARKIHGNKYYYSKVNYKNWHAKVIIICPKHGEFEQKARFHIGKRPSGCPKCNRGCGKGSDRRKDKTPGILYCIKCKWKDDSGYFTKIGITDRGLFKRFPKHPTKKYPFQILEFFTVDGAIGDMQRLEDKIKDKFLNRKYAPRLKFSGYTECFEVTEHDKIVRFIKKIAA